jgi:hypothetical protein
MHRQGLLLLQAMRTVGNRVDLIGIARASLTDLVCTLGIHAHLQCETDVTVVADALASK